MCGRMMRAAAAGFPGAGDGERGRAAGGCWTWAVDDGDAALPADARIAKALSILGPAAMAAGAVFAWAPWASWVVFAFGWTLFPVVGLLTGGLVDLGRAGLRHVAVGDGWAWWPGAAPAADAPRRRALVALWRIRTAAARTPGGHGRAELDGLVETSDRLTAAVVRGELPPAIEADAADHLLPAVADAVERFADSAHALPAAGPATAAIRREPGDAA